MKIPIAEQEVPAVVFVGVLLLAGAGAAAGTAASGSIAGEASTEVEQSILVASGENGKSVNVQGTSGADTSLVQVSDDETSFQAAATIQQGESYTVRVDLKNTADTELPAKLTLNSAQGTHVDVTSVNTGSDIEVQQVGPNEYLLNVPSGVSAGNANGAIDITFEAPNDAAPGFTQTTVEIQPVEV